MRELSLREIQLKEFEILVSLADFCKKNNIQYSLCSGTLLGAIRHKGFIPWDDDIDIQMPRDSYDRFLKLSDELSQYVVSGYGMVRGTIYDAPFVRVEDPKTVVKHHVLNEKVNKHLYIDILPIDGFPESNRERVWIMKKKEYFKKCMKWSNLKFGTASSLLHEVVRFPMVLICKMLGSDFFGKKWMKLSRKYDLAQCKEGAVIGGNYYGVRESFPMDQWFQMTTVEFEGKTFMCMGCWEEHLKRLYGDYMQLPPENERKRQHKFESYIVD